jgi:methylated-DNA-[protein]-cysteine S-methyltransferase
MILLRRRNIGNEGDRDEEPVFPLSLVKHHFSRGYHLSDGKVMGVMDNEFAFETRMGWIVLTWTPRGLRTLNLFGAARSSSVDPPAWVREAADRIKHHLAGLPSDLTAIPVDLEGLPPFRRKVLEALRATRLGETFTYGQLARMAGSPGASRAVGQAMAKNPLPIVIPCHRVVAADGPGGFSLFGSLESKERLLALENVVLRHT